MERTKKPVLLPLPDAINCSVSKEFTQISNMVLRNPELSGKAKAILCILLSNKEGWKSHLTQLQKYVKEQSSAIQSGLKELETLGYLCRIRYREKSTKTLRGSFWAYSDIPYNFNIKEHLSLLKRHNYEIVINNNPLYHFIDMEKPHIGNPYMEKPDMEKPDMENQPIIILDNNNINNTNTKSSLAEAEKKITPDLFESFWELYPNKAGKGAAITKWRTICSRKNYEPPIWNQIRHAIRNQKRSEQWQDPKYIPHASTWLNQFRWLDDPTLLKARQREYQYNKPDTKIVGGQRYSLHKDGRYYNSDNQLLND